MWSSLNYYFDPMVRLWSNLQGQPNSLQVIFGQVVWTPRPWMSGLGPKKWVFCQIYLLPGFGGKGVVLYLFRNWETMQKKCCERNFDFQPMYRDNRARRWGWPWVQPKFWNFNIFHKRDPLYNQVTFLCNFLIWYTPKAPEVPLRPRRVKIKIQNYGIFYRRDPH